MGALKDEAMPGSNRPSDPPASRTRPVHADITDPQVPAPDPNRSVPTDPLLPPPDPNRTVPTDPVTPAPDPNRVAFRPKDAGPDFLDTPEYVAPNLPPAETEHATFELQTVKVMHEERDKPSDPLMRQADIPTAPSTRIQRRRGWTIGLVLVGLGVVAGIGLFALSRLTRVEPVVAPSTVSTEPGESAVASTPEVTAAQTATATMDSTAPTASAKEPAVPEATAKAPPRISPPKASTTTKEPAAATGTTSTVPLGPPEF